MEKITRYKSFKTFQRVNSIKTSEPFFENSDLRVIEAKFNEYCNKFQQDLEYAPAKKKSEAPTKDKKSAGTVAEKKNSIKKNKNSSESVAQMASEIMKQNLINQRSEKHLKRLSEDAINTNKLSQNNLLTRNAMINMENSNTFEASLKASNKQGLLILEENIKAQHQKMEASKKLGLINPIVKMFGNTVVASVFESLVIKTIEDIFNVKVTEDLPISGRY